MALSLQSFFNSRQAVRLALGVGRAVPPRAGYPLARFFARRIAGRKSSPMVQAVRANQWVVTGERLTSEQLDEAVVKTFSHTATCLYNLYHNLYDDLAMLRLVRFSPAAENWMELIRKGEAPLVVVGLHLSNFDFILRAAASRGLPVLAIAIARERSASGYAWQNDLRRNAGLEILPASMSAMRTAVQRLKSGGTVLTGMDRPIPDSTHRPKFFGRPAPLPVVHVHLALRAKVPILFAVGIMRDDGIYEITTSDPIHMQPYGDKRTTLLQNAEAVLCVAEEFIKQVPYQWSMFYPVWPEVLPIVP
jgi:KDO2-lipid IV(A) lauroyltransferase